MGTGSLFAAVIAMAPFFESKAQMPIAIVDASSVPAGIALQELKRDAVCEALGMPACELHHGHFNAYSTLDGNSDVFYYEIGGAQKGVCVVELPNSQRGPSFSYIRSQVTKMSFDASSKYDDFPHDDIRAMNLLTQFANCVDAPGAGQKTKGQRNVAFSVLTYQLLAGKNDWLLQDGTTASLFVASSTDEAPIVYANGVAQRILMEEYKKNIAAALQARFQRKGNCSVAVTAKRDPLINPPRYVAPSQDTGRRNSEGEEYAAQAPFPLVQKISDCTTPPEDNGAQMPRHTIAITDDAVAQLAASAAPAGEEAETQSIFDRASSGAVSGVPAGAFAWKPFKNFGGSTQHGLDYSWGVANQLTGIR